MPQVTQDDLDHGAMQSSANVKATAVHGDREDVEGFDTAKINLTTLALLDLGEWRRYSHREGLESPDACSLL